ncbi:MAG: hypothetical protein RRA15_08755 [bacterium]|nr:hypothetical protein [bacterium]MDT8366571.1 hypothetical protein [bacterium]
MKTFKILILPIYAYLVLTTVFTKAIFFTTELTEVTEKTGKQEKAWVCKSVVKPTYHSAAI